METDKNSNHTIKLRKLNLPHHAPLSEEEKQQAIKRCLESLPKEHETHAKFTQRIYSYLIAYKTSPYGLNIQEEGLDGNEKPNPCLFPDTILKDSIPPMLYPGIRHVVKQIQDC